MCASVTSIEIAFPSNRKRNLCLELYLFYYTLDAVHHATETAF